MKAQHFDTVWLGMDRLRRLEALRTNSDYILYLRWKDEKEATQVGGQIQHHSSAADRTDESLRAVYEDADRAILNALKGGIAVAEGMLREKLKTLGVEFPS